MRSDSPREGKEFIGEVVDNNDPLKRGRARVRVAEMFTGLPDADLPWVEPAGNLFFAGGETGGFGCLSVPKVGARCKVRFRNRDDNSAPEYYDIQEPNDAMLDEISGSYLDSHVLAYDEDRQAKLIYTPSVGWTLWLDGSNITINEGDRSITIEHKGTESIIELVGGKVTIVANSKVEVTAGDQVKTSSSEVWDNGQVYKAGQNPAFNMVRSQPLKAVLMALAQVVDSKMYATPGVCSQIVEGGWPSVESPTCKVS